MAGSTSTARRNCADWRALRVDPPWVLQTARPRTAALRHGKPVRDECAVHRRAFAKWRGSMRVSGSWGALRPHFITADVAARLDD